jgi:GntR family transcriptional repressor for pyruvate dehydrogenase complex
MTGQAPLPALSDPSVAGVTRLSAVDTVRARIALAIEYGLIKSGERLPPDAEIATALGVSEITARRALKSMADENYLSRRRGRNGGTFVAEEPPRIPIEAVTTYRADAATVHDLIDQRAIVECALTHEAALVITADELADLRIFVKEAASARNWADYHAADEKLHHGIAQASRMPWALRQYEKISTALYRYFLPYPVSYLHSVNEEHSRILDALAKRDCIESVALMKDHTLTLHNSMFVGLPNPL